MGSVKIQYEFAVHLSVSKTSSRVKRIIRINGLAHPDKGTAIIAAKNIKRLSGAAVEWINVSRITYKSVAKI